MADSAMYVLVLVIDNKTTTCIGPVFDTLDKAKTWLENNDLLIGNSEWKIIKRAFNPNNLNIFLNQNMYSFIE